MLNRQLYTNFNSKKGTKLGWNWRRDGFNPKFIKRRIDYETQLQVDTIEYIKSEFFNCTPEIRAKIFNQYSILFGVSAYRYLVKTYELWKSGLVTPSTETLSRIIVCTPKFLQKEKRFYILKQILLRYVEIKTVSKKKKTISLDELFNVYQDYLAEFQRFKHSDLEWLSKFGIYSKLEIDEFIEISKYALIEKLKISYSDIVNDINSFSFNFTDFSNGKVLTSYHIKFLPITITAIDLKNIPILQSELSTFILPVIFKSSLTSEFEAYLIKEMINLDYLEKLHDIKQKQSFRDIQGILISANKMHEQQINYELSICIDTGGGLIETSISIVSYLTLNTRLAADLLILILLCGLAIYAVYNLIANSDSALPFFFGLFPLTFPLVYVLGSFIFKYFNKVLININERELYGY